jgi:hypothetical protein
VITRPLVTTYDEQTQHSAEDRPEPPNRPPADHDACDDVQLHPADGRFPVTMRDKQHPPKAGAVRMKPVI